MKPFLVSRIQSTVLIAILIGMQGCALKSTDEQPGAPVEPVLQQPVAEVKKSEPAFQQIASQPESEKKGAVTYDCQDFRVIGQIEPVTIQDAKMTLAARIDTGATTSSLDARKVQQFERDGRKWVRFILVDRNSGKEQQLEAKLTRTVVIKRHAAESQHRLVVKLKVLIGGKLMNTEFSLTDRSDFDFPVLVGRNILEAGFAVDVRRKNTSAMLNEE